MAKQISTEEWVRKARRIWGEEYDYSEAEYVNSKTKVTVICPGHGPWLCQPTNHTKKIKPRGCPKCGRRKQIEKASKGYKEFVRDARETHGEKYAYPDSGYVNARTEISIVCPQHGPFRQIPDAHLSGGQGCPECGRKRTEAAHRWTERRLNKELARLSDGVVSVVPGSYENQNTKATFHCKEHGDFERLPNTTLRAVHPCLRCGDTYRWPSKFTKEDVLERIQERFGPDYEVLPFEYKNQDSVITLVCRDHGEFSLCYASLRKSPGCRKCAHAASQDMRMRALLNKHEATRESRESHWLRAAKEFHNLKYDYSKVEYKHAHTKVRIICPDHGLFEQKPDGHMRSGCPTCANEEQKGLYTEKYFEEFPERKGRRATLYYVQFDYPEGRFYKVGVTSTTISDRFGLVKRARMKVAVLASVETTLFNAFKLEQEIQRDHGAKSRYRPKVEEHLLRRIRIGPTECFSKPLNERTVDRVFG